MITTATKIQKLLTSHLSSWAAECAKMRFPPTCHSVHSEVRVNAGLQRRRLDFVAVLRWSYKKPKDLFIIEIKSCLADFESDHKWPHYLPFCHYFCFAVPAEDSVLIQAILKETPASVGLLSVDVGNGMQAQMGHPVRVLRLPRRMTGDVGVVYETLFERAAWGTQPAAGPVAKKPRSPRAAKTPAIAKTATTKRTTKVTKTKRRTQKK